MLYLLYRVITHDESASIAGLPIRRLSQGEIWAGNAQGVKCVVRYEVSHAAPCDTWGGFYWMTNMLVGQRKAWIDRWEHGEIPPLAALGVPCSPIWMTEWIANKNSESWRMSVGIELLCSWTEWRDSKIKK